MALALPGGQAAGDLHHLLEVLLGMRAGLDDGAGSDMRGYELPFFAVELER